MNSKENLLMLAKLNLIFAATNLGEVSNELRKQGNRQDPTVLELSEALIQVISSCKLIIKKLEKEGIDYKDQNAEEYVRSHAPFESIAHIISAIFEFRHELAPFISIQDIPPFLYMYKYAVIVEFGMGYQ